LNLGTEATAPQLLRNRAEGSVKEDRYEALTGILAPAWLSRRDFLDRTRFLAGLKDRGFRAGESDE